VKDLSTRDQILDATERTLQTKGLARVTTKDIATAAGCAEGTLFNYFPHKEDLFLAVIREKVPQFAAVMDRDWLGQGTVTENLVEMGVAALGYYRQTVPMTAALFADPDLLARHQERPEVTGGRLRRGQTEVTAYLADEQRLGRIRPALQPNTAARLLIGACFLHVFEQLFLGEVSTPEADSDFIRACVESILHGLAS
jgi:AcrR family transcriptional regulator